MKHEKSKKIKEKEIQGMEIFCIITALAAVILSVVFLFDFLKNYWFLNFILGLGILLHVALIFLMLLRHRIWSAIVSGMFVLFYAGALIYFWLL